MNNVYLTGNLTKKKDIVSLKDGTLCVYGILESFSVETKKGGNYSRKTLVGFTAYDDIAKKIHNAVELGDKIALRGKLKNYMKGNIIMLSMVIDELEILDFYKISRPVPKRFDDPLGKIKELRKNK